MDNQTIMSALKSAQWEKAKGELHALVKMQGSYSGGEDSNEYKRFTAIGEEVEIFISRIENHGLHE